MKILPVTDQAVRAAVEAAALQDGDRVFGATHFLDRDGEVRGAVSIGGVTCTIFWSHTGNSKFASVKFVKASIEMAKQAGKPVICPCNPASPFVPFMAGFGFKKVGSADFWILK